VDVGSAHRKCGPLQQFRLPLLSGPNPTGRVLQRQRARSPGQNPDRSRRRAPPPCPRRTAAAGIPTALLFSDPAPPSRPYPLPVVLVEGKFASSPRKVASNSLLSAQRSAEAAADAASPRAAELPPSCAHRSPPSEAPPRVAGHREESGKCQPSRSRPLRERLRASRHLRPSSGPVSASASSA
jgi:hypothetical protein